MLGIPRALILVGSMALGSALMAVFVAGLIRIVRRAVARRPDPAAEATLALDPADLRALRLRLFFLILGIVIGSWFFTFGALSLALGI